MRFRRAIPTLLVAAWAILCIFDFPAAARNNAFKEGELLVRFKPGARSASRSGLERSAGVIQSQTIGRSGIRQVVLGPGASVDQALAVFADSPEVDFVEPNYLVRAQAFPGDSYFSRQWGLYNSGQVVGGYSGTAGADLDALQAWSITTGSSEVVVAVIDTGCDLGHPDLAANIWSNPGEIPDNGIDDDGNHLIDDVHGWDFSNQDNDPQDGSGHGSHVAGIIGAAGDNGAGIAGVAWQVRIMPLRFMNAFEEGTTADAIKAITYALDQGVKIINCSWGNSSYSAALRATMAEADALFICAAGNGGGNADNTPFYPASFDEDNILSVAASDQADHLAWFSNSGPVSVDVAAPGIRIYSLENGRRTLWSENFNAGWPDGWTTGGNGDTWAVADPPATPAEPALAINPADDYANDADAWIQTQILNLGTASASQLSFQLFGLTEPNADALYLEVSTDGSTWYNRPVQLAGAIKYGGISGSFPFWTMATADLGPYDGAPQLFIRLRFKSNSATTETGYFIDNLELSAAGPQDSYRFMQGTSMAAGYVSGVAALIASEYNTLSPLELKSVILNSVDLNQALLEQVVSGGRVNAYNALTLLQELSLTATSAAADRIQLNWAARAPLSAQITIERRAKDQSDFEFVAQVDADMSTYADSALTAGSTYFYRVRAETLDGRSGYSNQTLATTPGSNAVAGMPASSSGSGGGGCFIAAMTW